MREYHLYKEEVPSNRIADCRELQKYIRGALDIKISTLDTYHLWQNISDDWCASWLYIDTHYDDMTREEFLLYEMEKRGYFEEID